VRELVEVAFACVGLEADRYLRVDPALVRPHEDEAAIGDASRARERLGWRAEMNFEELIAAMVAADLAALAAAG
jgi:GDPmannose 4,6-dehydratase